MAKDVFQLYGVHYTSTAEFEMALQAINNDTLLNDIYKKHEASPSQLHAWKKQLFNHAELSLRRQLS